VLIVDLNEFKRINDEHGHGTGDECLKFVARFLESHLRDHDICCRTGGDEFTVILPEANAHGADRLIRRLREQLMRCNTSRTLPVQLSVGSATWPDHGRQPDDLLTRADEAMFADKSRQRGGRAARGARRDVTLPWMGLEQFRE
jgi:diguanylate cyclase (GGDEF)-like protein